LSDFSIIFSPYIRLPYIRWCKSSCWCG